MRGTPSSDCDLTAAVLLKEEVLSEEVRVVWWASALKIDGRQQQVIQRERREKENEEAVDSNNVQGKPRFESPVRFHLNTHAHTTAHK